MKRFMICKAKDTFGDIRSAEEEAARRSTDDEEAYVVGVVELHVETITHIKAASEVHDDDWEKE